MLEVKGITFTPAGRLERDRGLLGWVSATLDGRLRVDGIAVRRTRRGRLTLSWPCRDDRHGQRHYLLRPIDDVARREIERQIFEALAVEVGA